jgi:hypothetical protein
VPIYVAFLRGKGSVSGRIYLPTQVGEPVSGEITWFQPGQPAGMGLAVIGSSYVAPAVASAKATSTSPAVENTSKPRVRTVVLSGGDLPAEIQIPALIANNTLSPLPNSPIRRFSLTINPKNGKFIGEFKHPVTRKSNPIRGIILQLQQVGAGYFLGSVQSGAIVFSKN